VEGAVDVREVVGDALDRGPLAQAQARAQLLVVLGDVLDLGVRRPALHDEVDRLAQLGEARHVAVAHVAAPAPVVLAPGEALLLQARHVRGPAGDGDGRVLRAVDADDGRGVAHLRGSFGTGTGEDRTPRSGGSPAP